MGSKINWNFGLNTHFIKVSYSAILTKMLSNKCYKSELTLNEQTVKIILA